MKQYCTLSLQRLDNGEIKVYDFSRQKVDTYNQSLGEVIDMLNCQGFYVSAVDRISVDPEREDRLFIMTKEEDS